MFFRGKGGEMTQTFYAHMNKNKKEMFFIISVIFTLWEIKNDISIFCSCKTLDL
jgi:hypothetical protein